VRIAIAIRIDDRWRTIDKAGKWHTFSGSEAIVDGVQLVSLHGHTPGHTGHEFSSKGQRILFWGDTIHVEGKTPKGI
jgi:glyoxylase-like metal-dependent hydrolase (beta-lactamase superfamily II)